MIAQNDLISCDDHLDLNMLPADLWQKWLPEQYRTRAPHVEEQGGRAVWVCEGKVWGGWSGKAAPQTGPKPLYTALDRGGIVDQTERRPGVAALRLADMDRDGIYTHIIYGPVTSIDVDDRDFRLACYAAFNDWMEDFCSAAPDRLVGVAMLPPNPEEALQELTRIAAKGTFKQANIQIAQAEVRLEDERWEPVYALYERSGIIMSFHVTVFVAKTSLAFDKAKGSPGATFLHAKSFIEQFLDPFVDLFAWGILERHPGLRIVIAESGVGWVPWVVEELDYRHWRLWEAADYWDDKGGIPHKMKPSELFKRQVYGTFQQSPTAMRLLEFWGPDNLLWATDYPHPDSIWPNSHKVLEETLGHMTPEQIRKLTHDNAAKLYGIVTHDTSARLAAE